MTFTIACIFAAAALPYFFLLLSGLPSSTERGRWGSGYDNREARASLEQLTGWRKRAHFAQLNGHEAFPSFAAALICAQLAGADVTWVHALAIGFFVFRLAHGAAYLANLGIPRSVLWGAAVSCTSGLFIVSLLSAST
ncbi:MAG: MAPEG family protein [Archangium sp.]